MGIPQYNDIITISNTEISAEIIRAEKELFNLRFQKQSGDLSNTSRFSIVRKNIAS